MCVIITFHVGFLPLMFQCLVMRPYNNEDMLFFSYVFHASVRIDRPDVLDVNPSAPWFYGGVKLVCIISEINICIKYLHYHCDYD